jgi:AmiR/NasT family two-component response regulator
VKILIAEDDPVIALGLAERVRSLGHEALGPAGDGADAIELARQDPPDLYLFDIEMPNLDGLDAAEGAYLTKPVDTRELHAALALSAARHLEFQELEAEVDRAQQALEDRKVVERAKGLLMSALDLSEQDAFRRLQTTARERNLRLVEVAARIVEQQSLLEPKRKPASTR